MAEQTKKQPDTLNRRGTGPDQSESIGASWRPLLNAKGEIIPGVRALVAGGKILRIDNRFLGDEIDISPSRKPSRKPPKPKQPQPQSPLAAERATAPENRGLYTKAPGAASAQQGPQGVDYGEIGEELGSTLNRAAPQLLGIANIRAQGAIRGLLNKHRQGQKVSRDELQRAAMRLVEAERQAEYYGVGNPEFMDAVRSLSEISDSLLQEEGQRILDAARKGRASKVQIQKMMALDLALERQKQLLGLSDHTGLPDLTQQLSALDL